MKKENITHQKFKQSSKTKGIGFPSLASLALAACGGGGGSNIQPTPPNKTPVAAADKTVTLNEDTIDQALNITAPTDPDGNNLTITVTAVPTGGTLKTSDGTEVTTNSTLAISQLTGLVFTPNANLSSDITEFGSFTYSVSDGSLSDSGSIAISVTAVNDAPELIGVMEFAIDENNTAVADITATDIEGDTLTYSISGGDDQTLFDINASTGALSFKTRPDYENPQNSELNNIFAVTVTATDSGNLTASQTFIVTVNDVINHVTITNTAINENDSGAIVGTLSAAIDDTTATHSYTYSLSGTDASSFEVVSGELKLKSSVTADYETKSSYAVTVTATDSGSLTTSQAFTVTVNDTNDAPTAIALSATAINENAAGAVVGTLSTTDVDASDTHTYSLSGTDASSFEVVSGELKLKSSVTADYETKSSYAVTVTATDSGSLTTSQAFTVTVNDTNDAPTAIALSATAINENAAGAVVGTLSTTDVDAGDTHTYTLSGTDASSFEVVSGELKLKDSVTADYETKASYAVTVTATDSGSLTTSQAFTVTVNDVNEAPTGIALSATAINENAAGAVVGTLSTTDVDAGDTHTYTLSGTDASSFEVVSGELKLKDSVTADYETKASYAVTVTATDSGSLTTSQAFTVTVNDTPTGIALSATAINENAVGAVVGTLSTTDANASDSHTYSLSGTDASSFEVVSGQLKLKSSVSANYETKSSYAVTVTSTDSGGLTFSQAFTVTVNDVNEAPTAIALSATAINENAAGAVVGTLSTTDVDASDTHTYSLSGTDASSFEVVSGELKLKSSVTADYETKSSYAVTVTATDSGSLTTSQAFTVTVNDTNDAPTAIALSATAINENAAGAVVGTLSTTDVDAGDTHTYTLSGTDASSFEVVSGELKLKDSVTADYETKASYAVTVTATDSGSLTTSQAFTVTVNDVNDAPTGIALSATAINENAAGAVVGTLSTTDVDAGDTHTYTLSGTDASSFEVVSGELKLKDSVTADYETKSSYAVTVTATDSGSLTTSQAFTVTVNDVNDAPTGIALSATAINENAAGAVVGTLSTTDVDASDTHTYTLSGTDASSFEVVSGELKLKSSVSANYETKSSYAVTVTSTDSGSLTTSQAFTVTVNDVNEAPTAIALSATAINENAAGAVVGTLSTTDVDAGDTYTYSLSGTDASSFEVVSGELKLKDSVTANYEAKSGYAVTVTSNDSGSLTTSQAFTVTVNDTNDAPTGIALSSTAVNNNAAGAVVGTLSTTDVDASDTHTYSLSGTDASSFEVVSGELKLKDSVTADYETKASYAVTVTSTDSGSLTTSQAFTLTVNTVSLSATAINENAAGAVVGTISMPDSSDTHTYTLSGTDASSFEVVGGELKLKDSVTADYETKSSYAVTVIATDSEELTTSQAFTVTVNDVNEAPSAITLSATAINENAAGAVVGTLSTTDVDASDSHTYTLSGTDASSFEVVGGQLKLKDSVTADYETKSSYAVTVTATDSGSLTTSQAFTVTVNDVNDAPSAIALSSFSVNENSAGAVVGTLSTTDVDAGDSHTYSLSGTDASSLKWSVVSLNLKILLQLITRPRAVMRSR